MFEYPINSTHSADIMFYYFSLSFNSYDSLVRGHMSNNKTKDWLGVSNNSAAFYISTGCY